MYNKAVNLEQMVTEYEKESLERSKKNKKEISDNNEYMKSLALAKLQYQKEQQSAGYESVIDLSTGNFDQRMRWWTLVYYDNLEAEMFNLYSTTGYKYKIKPLPFSLEIMKEPKKEGGFRVGVDYRKFYDRYVKS